MASLLDLIAKGKELKPTATVVRGRDGRVKVERQELLSSSEQKEKIAASVDAGKKRGEAEAQGKDDDGRSILWKKGKTVADTSNDRIFPSTDGEVYEFYTDIDTASRGEWNVATRTNNRHRESMPLFGGRGIESIHAATFNIWFDEHEWKKRTGALLDLLLMVEFIDIICLQEVTPRVLGKIMENETIRREYYVTDQGPPYYRTLGRYGVAMLIRRTLPVPNVTWISLPTRMGRSALVASFEELHNSGGLVIATVHLESLASRETRARQLKIIRNALQRHTNAILVGDYNITATGPYGSATEHHDVRNILMEDYEDLWIREHGTDGDDENSNQFLKHVTYSSTCNVMLKVSKKRLGEPPDDSRLDRVLVRTGKSSPFDFKVHSIRIIGDQPIGPELYISDHFGLTFEISRVEKEEKATGVPASVHI